ncbi:SH3 domain-containing protein [Pseudodesulfovibrio sp.]|nr:SH3 domain-containing protein [Pseudodesulfovibrio sp.]
MKIIHQALPIGAGCLLILAGIALAAQLLSVQVRSGQLREKPGYLSRVVTIVSYGDRVDLKAEEGEWRKVTSVKQGKTGWMHISALTEQEIVLKPTNKDVEAAAQTDELALAGKGFNKQVEDKYKDEKELDYSKVDAMEDYSVSQEDVQKFIKSGDLGKGGEQ